MLKGIKNVVDELLYTGYYVIQFRQKAINQKKYKVSSQQGNILKRV